MRIEASNILNLYFKDIGNGRYFMGDVWDSRHSYSASLPAIVFPDGEEDNIKNKITELFGIDDFNEDFSLETNAYLLKDAQTIWGLVNNHGKIFSLYSMYEINKPLNNNIYSHTDLLELDYPGVFNYASRENIINSIVAFYLLENNDDNMREVCQKYYSSLLLNDDLLKNLDRNNTQKAKIKI
jgi:hypothetical protein